MSNYNPIITPSVADRVAIRAGRFLRASTGMVGAWLTPYNCPAFDNASAGGGASISVPDVSAGKWVLDTGTSGTQVEYLLPARPANYSGGYGGLVDANDGEVAWYACISLTIVSTPDADTNLGLGWRNQSSGAINGFLGLRGATSSTKLCFYGNSGTAIQALANLATGTRYFVEVYRRATMTHLYINKVKQASGNVFPIGAGGDTQAPVLYCSHTSLQKTATVDGYGLFVSRDLGI